MQRPKGIVPDATSWSTHEIKDLFSKSLILAMPCPHSPIQRTRIIIDAYNTSSAVQHNSLAFASWFEILGWNTLKTISIIYSVSSRYCNVPSHLVKLESWTQKRALPLHSVKAN